MKDKSHRATRRCYRSGVWTLRGTQARRPEGHSLYSASHVPIRAERQAGRRRVRQPDASSDGGLVLLRGIDTQLGLTKRLAACVDDERQAAKVRHGMLELVRQRVFGLAAGYADCNDAARLADDVIHKLVIGRDPIAGPALASQPTLSRFENAVGRRTLIAMGHVLADTVIEHHRRRLKGRATRITIDLDPTDDPTHGQQEFSFFNGP